MAQAASSLVHSLPKDSRPRLSAADAGRPERVRAAARWDIERLPWGHIAALVLGASVGAAAVYYLLRNDRGVTTSLVLLAAGLLVLACGGLLVSWRRGEALQRTIQRTQVILKLREYAEQMLESTPSGLVLLSPRHHVLFANRSFLERLHLGRDEVIGRRLAEINGAQELASALRQILDSGTIQDELTLATATDAAAETRPVRIMLKELNSCDDSREGQLLVIVEGLAESEYASAVAKSPLPF